MKEYALTEEFQHYYEKLSDEKKDQVILTETSYSWRTEAAHKEYLNYKLNNTRLNTTKALMDLYKNILDNPTEYNLSDTERAEVAQTFNYCESYLSTLTK